VEAEALSNALTSADGVILPLHYEYFALEGMQQVLNTIKLVRDRLNSKVLLFGVVLTMYDPRTRLAASVVSSRHLVSQILPVTARRARASVGATCGEWVLWSSGARLDGRVERRGRMRGGGCGERRPMCTPPSL